MMDRSFVEAFRDAMIEPKIIAVDNQMRFILPPGWKEQPRQPDPMPASMDVGTLTGLLDYIKANRDELDLKTVSVFVCGPESVHLSSKVEGVLKQRTSHIRAGIESLFGEGRFEFGKYMNCESFVIGLQTLFVDSPTRAQILQLVSAIRENQVKDTFDDGVAQSVTVAAGVALVGEQKVPNPVKLIPYRTFREIEQPESLFVLRLKQSQDGTKPLAALMEADGGAWKLEAIQRIAAYLKERIGEVVPVLA